MEVTSYNGLIAPDEFWIIKDSYISNGCGDEATYKIVPDKILGLDIFPACQIHDYMYETAKPEQEKKNLADRIFWENLQTIIDRYGGILRKLRLIIAAIYFFAVANFGQKAFWNNKIKERVENGKE